MFKDIKEKTNYYKRNILRQMKENNKYPSSREIEEKLRYIDKYLSIYKHENVKKGSYINIEKINSDYEKIYEDLKILYKVLYEVSIKELEELKGFSYSHLDEIESLTSLYEKKAEAETNSTFLGNTILFKAGQYNIERTNTSIRINLGNVSIKENTMVSFLINCKNIFATDIVCILKKQNKLLTSTAYNFNQESIFIEGDIEKIEHKTIIDKDQVIEYPIDMMISSVKQNSEYIIFGGEKQLLFTPNNIKEDIEVDNIINDNSYVFKSKGKISFYILNGYKIEFNFNKEPIRTNFGKNNTVIENLSKSQYFEIEADKGFAFNFSIQSGEYYAIRTKGNILSGKLVFSEHIDLRSFLIEEYKEGKQEEYEAYIEIKNNESVDIESIIIKELFSVEGVI